MKSKQANPKRKEKSIYGDTYRRTRKEILELSGLTAKPLSIVATILEFDYGTSLAERRGVDLGSLRKGFLEMLSQWSALLPKGFGGWRRTPTLPQLYLAWAWSQNQIAKSLIDIEVSASDRRWTRTSALRSGVVAATDAQKAIAHAKWLLMEGVEKIAA